MSDSPRYIQVAVPVPLYRRFDYRIPEQQPPHQFRIGQRVKVSFANRTLIGFITKLLQESETPEDKLKTAETFDEAVSIAPDIHDLLIWASVYYCHPIGECFQSATPTAVRTTKPLPNVHSTLWVRTEKTFEGRANASRQLKILEFIAARPEGVLQENLKLINATAKQLQLLEEKGYLKHQQVLTHKQKNSRPQADMVTLNSEQQSVYRQLSQANSFHVSLLEGITGSGKTEVYIQRVSDVLEHGGQALILIPEINLSPQTFARFQTQLATPISVIHSGLSEKERFTNWELARSGVSRVVIGTRSAIFTPFKTLKLIVVDEEHDSSYKQQDGFKYSARDLAVKRAQILDCPIILGSATPSIETLYNAQQGNYAWLKLATRAGAGQLPELKLIDIRSRPLTHGCSPPLFEAIERTLRQGNQVILFQNRRGFSPTLICDSCGHLIQCQHCDARMTVHQHPPHMHCHHCDFKHAIPKHCPECDATQFSPLGTGTERIEFGLAQRYPEYPVVRLDRDIIKNQKHLDSALAQINSGQPCLIVGTQMLSKGHDFHHVTLVAVMDADGLFFSADFRAIERGAQLLTQVSGRAGRGEKKGQVLIQTRLPEHPLFEHLKHHDYLSCALEQLEERKLCELPPSSKMISIRAESSESTLNINALDKLLQRLQQTLSQEQNAYQHIGPIEASMSRKKGIYRAYLSLLCEQPRLRSEIQRLLPSLVHEASSKGVRFSIDVDPQEYC